MIHRCLPDQDALLSHRFVVFGIRHAGRLHPSRAEALIGHLPPCEQQRALGVRLPGKRIDFILGRALLRRVLGVLLRTAPASLRITGAPDRKPRLDNGAHTGGRIFFNIAHTGTCVLVALSAHGETGVDVETVTPYTKAKDAIARELFHADEYQWLATKEPAALPGAFCHLWTVKEACAKARGTGLVLPLSDEPVLPGKSGRHGDLWWRVLPIGPSEKAAVAISLTSPEPAPSTGRVWMLPVDSLVPVLHIGRVRAPTPKGGAR